MLFPVEARVVSQPFRESFRGSLYGLFGGCFGKSLHVLGVAFSCELFDGFVGCPGVVFR